jgi:ubiquinone/menaquinone biosynthesis C-methylase UbiE
MTSKQEQIFFQIHRDNPREGPGNFESTQKAYALLKNLPEKPRILDIGCGPGKQTLDLAEISSAEIYAIDNHNDYLNHLNQKIKKRGLSHRVFPMHCDMGSLTFEEEYFDVIWAEGSIFIIGFEKGLVSWKPFLKPEGYVAVSELTWLRDDPPEELEEYMSSGYPAMNSIERNTAIIRRAGYKFIDAFILPENAWWDDYYHHIEKKIAAMKSKSDSDPDVLEILKEEEREIAIYRHYSDYYGYVFYIMQKQ